MDAGSRFAFPFHPAVAQAKDAVGAEQVFDQAQGGRRHHDLLERRIVPEHEAHQFLTVFENLAERAFVALFAIAGYTQQGVSDGLVLFGRADLVGR